MRVIQATLLLLACAACAGGDSAVLVTLRAGPRLAGFVDLGPALNVTSASGTTKVELANIQRIVLGERIDPNLENDALVAVGDLQSKNFTTREDAVVKLRKLGHAATKPLRSALESPEAETARVAHTLMAELGIAEQPGGELDSIDLNDGKKLAGEVVISDLTIRTRWGKLKTQAEMIQSIEFLRDPAALPALDKTIGGSKHAAREIQFMITDPDAAADPAKRWDPIVEQASDQFEQLAWLNETRERTLTMDQVPDKAAAGAKPKWLAAKAGDTLDDAFLSKGVRLRATEKNVVVEASAEAVHGLSGGLSAVAKKSDVEFTFLPATTDGPAASEVHGVFFAGCALREELAGHVGMAAFDASGRLLGQAFNDKMEEPPAPPPGVAVNVPRIETFLGLRSRVPIARVKLFRAPGGKEKDIDIVFDDFVFDRPLSCSLRANECRVELRSGERVAGVPVSGEKGSVALKLAWLGERGETVSLLLDEVKRYEPAREVALAKKKDKKELTPEEEKKEKFKRRLRAITPHAVMLQSGESFRARLIALDEKEALFWLAKGVEIKLPRAVLKIVDLIPDYLGDKKDPNSAVSVSPSEKPGILLKRKAGAGQPSAPLNPPEDTSDPKRYTAQGTDRVDDIEIAGVDPNTWMLILKDENGNESEIGMPGVRALIFAPGKDGAPAAQPRNWTLTLREGSRFDVSVKRILPDRIEAEMAGGEVKLPADVVESVERK